VRNENVAELRMQQPMHRLPVNDHAASDSGSNGDV
jgi:hypothetical protein